jgi:hypothetical protein
LPTVLITGSSGGSDSRRPWRWRTGQKGERPDLLLIGRPGNALAGVAAEATAAAASAREIG